MINKIISITKIAQILPVFNALTPNSLVIWDFNNTLLMHWDRIIRVQEDPLSPFESLKKEMAEKAVIQGLNPKNLLSTALVRKGAYQLIEPELKDILNNLHINNIPTTVLTSCTVGKYGISDQLHLALLEQLNDNGISFNSFMPALSSTTLELSNGSEGLFLEGVIFNNNNPKHLVLRAFLEKAQKLGWKPSEIIFIDDLMSHIEGVSKEMEDLKINFTGVHYTHVQTYTHLDNPALFKSQFNTLLKNHFWPFESEIDPTTLLE